MKAQLAAHCKKYVEARLERVDRQITAINNALYSESKSSAGDKHETGRAMLQLEREKLGSQLAETEKLNETLAKVSIDKQMNRVGLGCLFSTAEAHFFIAISAGIFELNKVKVFCISIQTPIAQKALGKQRGDTFEVNGLKHTITDVK